MPASCLTSSGWPSRPATSSRGLSSVERTATEPETTRTRSAATPSKSSVVGVSTVQCCMAPALPNHRVSNKIYRVSGKAKSVVTGALGDGAGARRTVRLAPAERLGPDAHLRWFGPGLATQYSAGQLDGQAATRRGPALWLPVGSVVVQPGQPAG